MITVSKKPKFTLLNFIPYETTHGKLLGAVDVTHKPAKGLIAVGGPLGNAARETLHGTQKIVTSHASSKQQLHKDSACDGCKFALGFCLGLHRAGQGRAGQGRAGRGGQGRAGQGRAGQGRAGQGRAGQGRAGQGRAGRGAKPLPPMLLVNLRPAQERKARRRVR